jgi:hypothetical protein
MALEGRRKGQARNDIEKEQRLTGDEEAYSGEGSCAEGTEDGKTEQREKQGWQ